MVVATIMLLGMPAAVWVLLPEWARDYGAGLVYLAVLIYAGLAVRLLWWGVAILRTRVAETEAVGAPVRSGAGRAGTKDPASRAERP
ncbi:hypothetical protein [Nocardia gamkensis]|uniref:Uncharacterized protein n=1 Tax=Nocardia gamkensis TaxID=352869 RepID=A0A7X6R6S7_9NOCA|nr:hypothetical protein [Nocardia gamkensis]NKY30864.1 hypothetical protein [Nocardia gamkensis]NQE72098.1 hypothetical protein [Nocardia gamkensis]